MPLQPTDTPSRTGIQAAIDEAVDNHASLIDVNGQHYDSGWIDIPLRTGFQTSGETPRYRRIGRMVFVQGRVQPNPAGNFAANTLYVVGDIPTPFRPARTTMFAVAGANGTTSGGRFWFGSPGEINVQTQNATSNVSLSASYLNN